MSCMFNIIGAGLAGLTLANSLKNKGYSFKIYDKQPPPKPHTSHVSEFRVTLQGNGIVALQECLSPALFDKIMKSSIKSNHNLSIVDAKSLSPLLTYTTTNQQGGSYSISSSKLAKLLLSEVDVNWSKTFLGAQYHTPSPPTPSSQSDSGSNGSGSSSSSGGGSGKIVTARFDDKTEAESEYIIGCDGLTSVTRKQLLSSDAIHDTGYRYIQGAVPIPLPSTSTSTSVSNPDISSSSLDNLLRSPLTLVSNNGFGLHIYALEEMEGVSMMVRWKATFLDESYQGKLKKKSLTNDKKMLKDLCLENMKDWNSDVIQYIHQTSLENISSLNHVHLHIPKKIYHLQTLLLGDAFYTLPTDNAANETALFHDIYDLIVSLVNSTSSTSKVVLPSTFTKELVSDIKSRAFPLSVTYQSEFEMIHATHLKVYLRRFLWNRKQKKLLSQ